MNTFLTRLKKNFLLGVLTGIATINPGEFVLRKLEMCLTMQMELTCETLQSVLTRR